MPSRNVSFSDLQKGIYKWDIITELYPRLIAHILMDFVYLTLYIDSLLYNPLPCCPFFVPFIQYYVVGNNLAF